MKKSKKSKLKFSRIFLVLLVLIFFTYLSIKFTIHLISENVKDGLGESITSSLNSVFSDKPKYEIIKTDTNENYAGKRKRKDFSEKIGYTTTFTTIDNNKKVYIEYKQNGDSSWSQKEYWDNNMETSRMWYHCNVHNIKWIWQKLYAR